MPISQKEAMSLKTPYRRRELKKMSIRKVARNLSVDGKEMKPKLKLKISEANVKKDAEARCIGRNGFV